MAPMEAPMSRWFGWLGKPKHRRLASKEAWREVVEEVMCVRTMMRKAKYPREMLDHATDLVAEIPDRKRAIEVLEAVLKPFEYEEPRGL